MAINKFILNLHVSVIFIENNLMNIPMTASKVYKEVNKQTQKQGYKDAHELKKDFVPKKMVPSMI